MVDAGGERYEMTVSKRWELFLCVVQRKAALEHNLLNIGPVCNQHTITYLTARERNLKSEAIERDPKGLRGCKDERERRDESEIPRSGTVNDVI